MKWLRVLHLILVSIWFGATVCIGFLSIICFYHLSTAEFLIVGPLIPELYQKIVLPVAVLTILQGIIYGSSTKWGFFKYPWVMLKWILTFLLIPCVGLGTIGQLFSVLDVINTAGFSASLQMGGRILLCIALQISILLVMIGVSVLKPGKLRTIG
ncbi:MAG: hypothetical protein GXX02_03675 [Syntrophomonadaceae bacterium]|jgi:hypothetical protein|nr:hypothetical protein [Syntrophomonadaceae bacterium]